MSNSLRKKKGELVPGTLVQCKSGSFLAYYEHRTDIVANGENEIEARKNLRELYKMAIELEEEESEPHEDDDQLSLPAIFTTKQFKERLNLA